MTSGSVGAVGVPARRWAASAAAGTTEARNLVATKATNPTMPTSATPAPTSNLAACDCVALRPAAFPFALDDFLDFFDFFDLDDFLPLDDDDDDDDDADDDDDFLDLVDFAFLPVDADGAGDCACRSALLRAPVYPARVHS